VVSVTCTQHVLDVLDEYPSIRTSILQLGLLPAGDLPGNVAGALDQLVAACTTALAIDRQLLQQLCRATSKPYAAPTTTGVQGILEQAEQQGSRGVVEWMQQEATKSGRVAATGTAFTGVAQLLQEGQPLDIAVCAYRLAVAVLEDSNATCAHALLRLRRVFASVIATFIWIWEKHWGPFSTWLMHLRKHFSGWYPHTTNMPPDCCAIMLQSTKQHHTPASNHSSKLGPPPPDS
jgi:hypothetical protein